MRRSDIWVARLHPNVGAEIGKIRPVVILMEDRFIDTESPVIMAAPLTTQYWPSLSSLRIRIPARGACSRKATLCLSKRARWIEAVLEKARSPRSPLKKWRWSNNV